MSDISHRAIFVTSPHTVSKPYTPVVKSLRLGKIRFEVTIIIYKVL